MCFKTTQMTFHLGNNLKLSYPNISSIVLKYNQRVLWGYILLLRNYVSYLVMLSFITWKLFLQIKH